MRHLGVITGKLGNEECLRERVDVATSLADPAPNIAPLKDELECLIGDVHQKNSFYS